MAICAGDPASALTSPPTETEQATPPSHPAARTSPNAISVVQVETVPPPPQGSPWGE